MAGRRTTPHATVMLTGIALLVLGGCAGTNVVHETVVLPHGPVDMDTSVSTAARLTGDDITFIAQGETWYHTRYCYPPPPESRFSGSIAIGYGSSGWRGGGYRDFDDYPPHWRRPLYPPPLYWDYYESYLYSVFLIVTVDHFPERGTKAKVDLFPRQVTVTFGEFVAPTALARTELIVESAKGYWDGDKPVIEFETRSCPAPPPAPAPGATPKGETTVTVIQAPIYVRAKLKGDLAAKRWAIVADRFRQRGAAQTMGLPEE